MVIVVYFTYGYTGMSSTHPYPYRSTRRVDVIVHYIYMGKENILYPPSYRVLPSLAMPCLNTKNLGATRPKARNVDVMSCRPKYVIDKKTYIYKVYWKLWASKW
jgi:hypothetical protein